MGREQNGRVRLMRLAVVVVVFEAVLLVGLAFAQFEAGKALPRFVDPLTDPLVSTLRWIEVVLWLAAPPLIGLLVAFALGDESSWQPGSRSERWRLRPSRHRCSSARASTSRRPTAARPLPSGASSGAHGPFVSSGLLQLPWLACCHPAIASAPSRSVGRCAARGFVADRSATETLPDPSARAGADDELASLLRDFVLARLDEGLQEMAAELANRPDALEPALAGQISIPLSPSHNRKRRRSSARRSFLGNPNGRRDQFQTDSASRQESAGQRRSAGERNFSNSLGFST